MIGLYRERRKMRADMRALYARALELSRRVELFAPGFFPDSENGRLASLLMHVAMFAGAMQDHDRHGKYFALLTENLAGDMDAVLRERGLSDAGLQTAMRRIMERMLSARAAMAMAAKGDITILVRNIAPHLGNSDNAATIAAAIMHDLQGLCHMPPGAMAEAPWR